MREGGLIYYDYIGWFHEWRFEDEGEDFVCGWGFEDDGRMILVGGSILEDEDSRTMVRGWGYEDESFMLRGGEWG